VKLGNMDTIYKEYGQVEEMFGLTSGNFISPSNVLSQIASETAARQVSRARQELDPVPDARVPRLSGRPAVQPDETKNDVGNTLNKELWSMGVKWESGPLYLSAQYERHKDFFGGSFNVGASTLANLVTDASGNKVPAPARIRRTPRCASARRTSSETTASPAISPG